MKILHLNSYYAQGYFYKNLYDEQINQGVDISVFVPVKKNFKKNSFNYGNYTKICPSFNEIDRYFFHIKQKKIKNKLNQEYNIQKFDLIHAHTLFTNGWLAYQTKIDDGIPYLVTVRNTDVNLFLKKLIHLRNLGIKIMTHAEKVIFLSKAYRDEVLKKYIPQQDKDKFLQKCVIIPNGIDNFWFKNIGKPKGYDSNNELKLLYVGEINKNKNIETTIEAVKGLKNNDIEVILSIVGKKNDKKIFDKVMAYDFVHYLGTKSKEDLLSVYREHDIFVMPSIHETFGLVYAEAMSQGLPVIYSIGQGFDGQFCEGDVGFHVKASDYLDLHEKIYIILKKYNDISKRCIELSNKFSWNQIILKINKIYNECLK
ncbi:glycosyltransferase family 4 protein [Eubacterium sp. 1001713B170207_170306_E7]|uniref:glycosyltransferase family 4 protein n=1 Tax=Eubacterium sp. 1001713B170207_170306_E7 TaxID=2787097 RepID=UPI00189AAEE1|nr:glycosyltransferase family 4 protein [Eubacterium sp. 1001713B170207_170306_E7]